MFSRIFCDARLCTVIFLLAAAWPSPAGFLPAGLFFEGGEATTMSPTRAMLTHWLLNVFRAKLLRTDGDGVDGDGGHGDAGDDGDAGDGGNGADDGDDVGADAELTA